MEDFLLGYQDIINTVLEETPITTLDKYLGKDSKITASELLQISVRLGRHWEKYKNQGICFIVMIMKDAILEEITSIIFQQDFDEQIREIKQNGKYKSCIFLVDIKGNIISKQYSAEKVSVEKSVNLSNTSNGIALYLGIRGVDIIIKGNLYESANYPKSYSDLVDTTKQLGIDEYKKLVKSFIEKDVQYDPGKKYFLRKTDTGSQNKEEIFKKYPKLLRSKPEEIFQSNFVSYLREYCTDIVTKEVQNNNEDRYDVFVLSGNDDIYIFEIKWLGCSISSNGNIFDNYNKGERAIEGAYQLLDYIENAEKYKVYLAEYPIYCAVLLVFDARDTPRQIDFPLEFKHYPNIDLSQIYSIEKNKTSASQVFRTSKRGIEKNGKEGKRGKEICDC